MNKAESGTRLENHIKGLTAEQVEWSLFHLSDRDFEKWFPTNSDFIEKPLRQEGK